MFTDAGTDCALGEVFNIDVPSGHEAVQLEVYAKHNITGDDHIGTATISLEALKVGAEPSGLVIACVGRAGGGGVAVQMCQWGRTPVVSIKILVQTARGSRLTNTGQATAAQATTTSQAGTATISLEALKVGFWAQEHIYGAIGLLRVEHTDHHRWLTLVAN
jgi:hypothetical protein